LGPYTRGDRAWVPVRQPGQERRAGVVMVPEACGFYASPMDVAEWLRGFGLEQYAPAFRDNDIDGEVLRRLTGEDLRELGVKSIGHRRRLLDAISALGAVMPSVAVTTASHDVPPLTEAERRQLTVMFCDLVGSTELAARLDPEDLRDVIGAYHRAVAGVVRSFEGFVAKYMGDGVLAYFGYPQAHEDDAERAVRAGLGAIQAVGRLDVKSVKLKARVGIATGLVVVGDLIGEGSAQEQSVVGETPNLAARLQALAAPDAVVIAAATRRLVGDLFEYRDLGAVEIKGIAGPVPVWQVLRPSAVASRFEALRGSALTPLVGRDEEIDLLMRRWARAKGGDGQVVLVSGEPGLGKSRISAALEERSQAEPHFRQRYFCSPYRQDSSLYPFIDQIERAARFAPVDLPASKLEKLESLLARGSALDEDIALIADLLSMPSSERHPSPDLSPQRKKERTLEALIGRLESLARRRPVLIIFEDAHWIDPTSRELLDLAVERVRNLPVLLVVTFRPEFQPPWTDQPHVTILLLNRLDNRNRTALVKQIVGGKALPDAVVAQIVERTDGVPLFIEELTKSVLESGLFYEEEDHSALEAPLPPLAIPTSLHGSLMARLDRLGSVRHLAQIGAAFGRWFRYTSLRAVSGLPEDELQAALARLVASELVFQNGTPPDAVYTFKHALVQEAAYGSLLRTTRQELHGRIAETLETLSPELIDSQPEFFARHYAEAGLVDKSVSYWSRAGHKSVARAAIVEAAAQFQKGLDQLALLPESRERQRQELEFYSSLSAALRAAKGQGAPETGHAYARARELWKRLGSPSEFVQIPYGQSRYHAHCGEFDLARRLDEDLLRLSRQRNDAAGLVLGHLSTGINLMFVGMFALSRSHLEEALALYDPISQRSLVRQAGVHPHIFSQAYLGNVLFYLGFPDQALAKSNAIISEARRLAHPPSLAGSLAIGVRLLSLVGDDAALEEGVNQLIAVATEQGFPHWRAQGAIYRGWLKVKNGDTTEGMTLLQGGLTAYRAGGAELFVPHYFALLAAACEIAGRVEDSLTLLGDALDIVERTGERWFATELNRQKGQLLLRQGCFDAAEELYRKALSIAEEQEAKLLELRAAMSLARLCRKQNRPTEARELLAPVYSWFTEGFDTTNLKEAKTLLDELS
jgi:class 3 adenylate cyclase/predicted ATPase